MKRYRLLRDNHEFGPLLLGELRSFGLYTTDLIWIEGESNCWEYPTEISELKPLVQKRPVKPAPVARKSATRVNERSIITVQNGAEPELIDSFPELGNSATADYFSATKEKIEFRSRPKKLNLNAITTNLFGLGVLLVGVMMGAFVVKKIVDHFEFEPVLASANAVEVTTENLPVSTGSYAAKSMLPSSTLANPMPVVRQADSIKAKPVQTKQMETVAAAKSNVAPVQDETEKSALPLAANTDPKNEEVKEAVPEQKTEKPAAAESPKKAPSLSLAANNYKVGMFGGISDLEITVNNPSSMPVNKAVVQVEFLKPNGNVVKTQTLSVENISPGGTKKVSVPSSNRGVSVRYRIVGVDV